MLKNEIKIECSTNDKTGYKSVSLVVNGATIILRDLSRFEINYIHNRSNRVKVAVRCRRHQGFDYDVLVIHEVDGFDDEEITLRLSPDVKRLLVAILLSEDIG